MNHRDRYRHPGLIRFLFGHFVAGSVGAVVFLAGLLLTDFGGIATMAGDSPHGLLFIAMLLFALCLTFGAVAMGVGVMRDHD